MTIVKRLADWLRGRRAAPATSSTAVLAGVPLADDSPLVTSVGYMMRYHNLVNELRAMLQERAPIRIQ